MDEKLEGILRELPFELNSDQKDFIISYINGKGHYCLLGEAGSGKSLVINVLKAYYEDEMVLSASTGTANQNLLNGVGGEGTTHKVMSLPFHIGDSESLTKVRSACSDIFAKSDLVKHVIVDEAFMLNPEHLKALLLRLKRFNKRTTRRKRRDIRVLLVGDPAQIPPVIKDDIEPYLVKTYGSKYIFDSNVWNELNPTVKVFTKVMRQGDKTFIAALNVLRYNETHRFDNLLKWLNTRVNRNYRKDKFTVSPYLKTVESVNNKAIEANPNDKFIYSADTTGNFDFKEMGVERDIVLCQGLKCITTVNCEEGNYNNGSFCEIISLQADGCYCYFPVKDEEFFVPLHEYKQTESFVVKDVIQADGSVKDELRRKEVATCLQTPLLPASAITCHRAQGKTFELEGVLNMGYRGFRQDNDYGQNLLYVSLSRWISIDLIELAYPLTKEHIKVCQPALDFWNRSLEENNGRVT